MSSCLFNFGISPSIMYTLWGIGTGSVMPSLISYFKLTEAVSIHSLLISNSLPQILSPLLVIEVVTRYEKQMFAPINFLWSLLFIVGFVGVLNNHASRFQPQNSSSTIWNFFQGSGKGPKRVRRVMRSFRNKSMKTMSSINKHTRTWSTKRVVMLRKSTKRFVTRKKEEKDLENSPEQSTKVSMDSEDDVEMNVLSQSYQNTHRNSVAFSIPEIIEHTIASRTSTNN
uniref:EamA domain-containing protein n=1 Tax=Rhabditophanes sp. KR3021 TaxID=114890 RepID=A0AC35UFV3_9BILA